jgi:hypothetical protein
MKRQTKKIILISAAALAVIVLVAGLVMLLQKDAFGDNYFARNKAVATVNGAKITKNEYTASLSNYYNNIDYYNMYASYGYGTYYDKSSEADMMKLKNEILNNLIDNEVYIQMAKDLGITLTDEEKTEVAQSAKDDLANLKEQILESAKSSAPQTAESYAVTMLANYFSNLGINQSTYLKRSQHAALAEKYASKIQEYYAAERNVSEEELKDVYAEYVKEYYQDGYTDGAYSQNESYVAAGYTNVPYLYIPEDFIFVRVIQMSDEEKAKETLEKIQAGEDFETFFASDDNENTDGKALADKPQAIGAKDSAFDDEIYKQVGVTAIGDVTMIPVEGTDAEGKAVTTYHIVKRVQGNTGVVPYEEVKDVIDSSLRSHLENEYYSAQMDAWREKASIEIDEDVFQSFDPAA